KMEQSLLQSQKMESIGILTGGIAHDFNNILTGIVSTVSLAEYEMANNDFNKDRFSSYISIMKEAGNRASDMIQQLLSISRKNDARLQPVDLSFSISQVLKICASSFDKRITVSSDIPAGKILIYADRTRIEQVLLNLMINAGHAVTLMRSSEAQYGGTISLSVEEIVGDSIFCGKHPEAEYKSYWKIAVRDDGVGMDAVTVSKIFIPFFSTKRKGQGSGLGLAMVYNIIQEHQGFIDVYSEPGKGSAFNVYIPRYMGKESSPVILEQPVVLQGSGLILIADDEAYILQLAKSILEKSGYAVLTAVDGDDAVKTFMAHSDEITAVLLDLVMPKKSGEQVYHEIKAIRPDIRVLMSSGFRLDERVSHSVRSGINGFIQKPYTVEQLSRAVFEVVYGKCV
ncbi:MAG: hybrid sensor histidine kinase/response regulator, partial [Spirochaetota bacterium]